MEEMETISEAANNFSNNVREHSLVGSDVCKTQYKIGRKIGFKAGVEFAQQWIPVEEELPENIAGNSDDVLLKCTNGDFVVGWYNFNDANWRNTFNEECEEVTHWRPIELK